MITAGENIRDHCTVICFTSGFAGCFFGSVQNWIKGEGTPAQHYAAVESAVNETVKYMLGAR